MTRVFLERLVKRFDREAVVDLDSDHPLEVRPGELVFLLGPSGAGKTTLARLIAGLERPDEGEVYFDGRLMNDVPPRERKVGLVFQDDALWPHLTIAENVGYGLRLRGVGRRARRDRVSEALTAARIDSLADRRPGDLNGLQKLRAALARALVTDPDLLILDEPLARLEPRFRDEFRDEIRRTHEETERTTIVLTSDPREAMAAADRIAVMDLGRIVQSGTPEEVYNRPADALVAQLLGPANLLQGKVETTDSRGEVIVRTPIGRLVGRSANGPLDGGSSVTLAIRPDALSLTTSVPANCNRFVATLERQVFLGEVRQVHLRGPGDWPLTALALQAHSQGLREGQSVTVSVSPEMVVILAGRRPGPR